MPRSISGTSVLSYDETGSGLVVQGTVTAGYPPTTASTYATGCVITDLSTGTDYKNIGTSASPSWAADGVVSMALTSANLLAMFATPVLVVPAVTGKAIVVDAVELIMTRTGTAYAGGGVVAVQYDSTANGAGTATHATVAATVLTGAAGTTYTARIPVVLSDIATASISGIALYISNATAAFTTGTGTAVLNVRYHLI